jgi:hypothetical protein
MTHRLFNCKPGKKAPALRSKAEKDKKIRVIIESIGSGVSKIKI